VTGFLLFSPAFPSRFAGTVKRQAMVLRQGFTSLLARSVLDAGSDLAQVSISEEVGRQSLENPPAFLRAERQK